MFISLYCIHHYIVYNIILFISLYRLYHYIVYIIILHISLSCFYFVILFLFLPRISDGSALDIFNNEPIQAEEIIAPEVVVEYKVVILNDLGDILFSESELDD